MFCLIEIELPQVSAVIAKSHYNRKFVVFELLLPSGSRVYVIVIVVVVHEKKSEVKKIMKNCKRAVIIIIIKCATRWFLYSHFIL